MLSVADSLWPSLRFVLPRGRRTAPPADTPPAAEPAALVPPPLQPASEVEVQLTLRHLGWFS